MLGSKDLLVNTIVLALALSASLFAFYFVEFFVEVESQGVLLVADLVACVLFIALTALLTNRQILVSTFLMLTMIALTFHVALLVNNERRRPDNSEASKQIAE